MTKHSFPNVKSNPRALTASGVPLWQPYQRKYTTLPGEVLTISMYGEPLDQGNKGDCAAVSSRKARMAARALAGLAVVPISYYAQYDQARVIMGTMGQDTGETAEAEIQVYEQYGAIPESLYPETDPDFNNVPPANLWDASWKLKPTQVFHTTSLQDYKDACAVGYPVLVAFEVFQELEGGIVANTGWLPMPADPTNPIGGHQEVGGGYSDSLGAALIGNQWGDSWGIQNDPRLKGCHWMPYEYFEKYVMDVIIFAPDNGVQPVPFPAPAPFTKPVFDVYTAVPSFSKPQYNVGETITFNAVLYKNGAPLTNQSGIGIQVNYDNTEMADEQCTTDSNGAVSYSFTLDHTSDVAAAVRWLTPYGDMIDQWAFSKCVAPAPTKLYHVQVEADSVQANAVATEAKVRAAGFPVFIKHEADGLYHVQVGAFASQANAEADKAKLIAAGFTDAFIKFE